MYAQNRRRDLGNTGGTGGAADYLTKLKDRIVRVGGSGDLRKVIGIGFALIWQRNHWWLTDVGKQFGHVAIVEEVGSDSVIVSQAGVGSETDLRDYTRPSMRMRLNRRDLADLFFIS